MVGSSMSVLVLTLEIVVISALTSISLATANPDHSFLAVGPPIIAAFGTVAAFTVTFALFLRGSRDRVREQASSVYATRIKDTSGVVTATVHNASSLPIWHVEARPLAAGKLFDDGIPQPSPSLAPQESADFIWEGAQQIERDWRIRFVDAADRGW